MKKDDISHTGEWLPGKRWNPFNSYKLLVHTERWKKIRRGRPIPPPVLVTVDPTNVCNYNCIWCNAHYIRNHRNSMLSSAALCNIADFLPQWGSGYGYKDKGVSAICIAGGGEPLLNSGTPEFIDRVRYHDIEIGMVTNGSHIHNSIDALSQLTWVGVSIDAGTSATFDRVKALHPEKQSFSKVVDNIAKLVDYSNSHRTQLGEAHPSYGVSYKYLLHPENVREVFQATKLAKEIGCKNIHFRPAGTPWDKIDTGDSIAFTQEEIKIFYDEITRAMELDDEHFSVYGVTHKFDTQFGIANEFKQCHAIFMTAVFAPPSKHDADEHAFTLGLCCDRRGDKSLELISDAIEVEKINTLWGSQQHWRIFDDIAITSCPRCTYQPHNQIYEHVILNDSMTYKFI